MELNESPAINAKPLVSVLMTAFNRELFIAEAIDSVLASDYKTFELIIVDDASTDKTLEIAEDYRKRDCRIRLFRNTKNLGQFTNRNKAATYANGKYIMHVDSDDTIYTDVISKCVTAMESFPNNNFGMKYINEILHAPVYLSPEEALHKNFFDKYFLGIGPGSTIIKRDFFLSIGGYTDKYGAVGDMYFNLKACSKGGIILLPFDFVFYRRHDGQEINNPYSYLYNTYRYFNDALTEIDLKLTAKQLNWLSNKNKRRFVTNIFKYFRKSYDLPKTAMAVKLANFTFKDFVKGVFH